MDRSKELTLFITGATGHMGMETLKLLAADPNIRLKLLSLPDRKSRKKLKTFTKLDRVKVIWGDLRNLDDVRQGVAGSDYVLHLGALIPPVADKYPELAEQINYGGTLNIIKAIKEQPDHERIRLVYIATVASMGNRLPPVHWARAGDPIQVSRFDAYGVSKVKAERAVIESGLKYWVSLRQSGMLHHDFLRLLHPILFHQPLDTHIEWSTAEDSGRALFNLCRGNLADAFWRNIYNIGSGPEFRVTYYEFLKQAYKKMGVKDFHRVLKPNDFASKNFHCVWYSDSDRLNEWLDFRRSTYKGFWDSIDIPFYVRLAPLLPAFLMRKWVMEPLARREEGTLNWIKNNHHERIKAFWGSREKWEKIPHDWSQFRIEKNPEAREILHGYDESLPIAQLRLIDCQQAAHFRGGSCLSSSMTPGDIKTPLEWKCAEGHNFSGSPNLVLKGGHWCPYCDTDNHHYQRRAKGSPFFAQVF